MNTENYLKGKCIVCEREILLRKKPRRGRRFVVRNILGKNRITCSRKCAKVYERVYNRVYEKNKKRKLYKT